MALYGSANASAAIYLRLVVLGLKMVLINHVAVNGGALALKVKAVHMVDGIP